MGCEFDLQHKACWLGVRAGGWQASGAVRAGGAQPRGGGVWELPSRAALLLLHRQQVCSIPAHAYTSDPSIGYIAGQPPSRPPLPKSLSPVGTDSFGMPPTPTPWTELP
jgi:hypothetical protein